METDNQLVKINLTQVNGNAFAILGAWKNAAKLQGWGPKDISAVIEKATAGDYDHLLMTISMHSED